jgi:hypothetical protein
MNANYPDADRQTVFQEGLEFQDFVANLLLKEMGIVISNYSSKYYQQACGENAQGFEIKLDRRILETGHVSIEVAEKSKAINKSFVPSGIMREDNSWLYIQGNKKIIFIFGKKSLQQLYQAKYKDKVWQPKPTIKTFRLPIAEARKYALKVFENEHDERIKGGKIVRVVCVNCGFILDVSESEIISNTIIRKCPICPSNAFAELEGWKEFQRKHEEEKRYYEEETIKIFRKNREV